ncbi:g8677 [Coccomyxa elongata]
MVDVLLTARRPRRLLVSCTHDSSANKCPSAVTAHRASQRRSNREPRIVCAAKKKKQQFGPSAGVAVPGMLDEEVEAAYKQFGRALGETPRETSKVVRAKYNIPAAPPQPLARRPVSPGGPSERRFTEESYAQFEALLDGAMKGSGDSQPRALVKGKNTVALQAGERERRKVMMELMESTLSPEAAPFSLDLGLDRIRPKTAQRPEEEVPQLILPRDKVAAPAKQPAEATAEGAPRTRAGPLPVPALQMPRGKLSKRERPIAAAAAPVAPPRPLPTPTIAPKPGLAPPKDIGSEGDLLIGTARCGTHVAPRPQ